MSIVNFDPGEIAYEAYKLASDGVSLVSGAALSDWADQEPAIRQAWSAVEDGVIIGLGAMRQELPLDEPKPQPAKVIVVTEARSERDRWYDANQAEVTEDGHLRLLRKGREIGGYQLDGWLSWREDGVELPDATQRALGIAKRALEAVARISDPNVAVKLATDALEDIWTETEG